MSSWVSWEVLLTKEQSPDGVWKVMSLSEAGRRSSGSPFQYFQGIFLYFLSGRWRALLKSSIISYVMVICGFIWQGYAFQTLAYAEGNLGESIDCTDVHVDYSSDSTLTKEERIRLMDKAFYKSLNKFELCQLAKEKAKAAAGTGSGNGGNGGNTAANAGGNGATNGSGNSADKPQSGLPRESVASSTMSGTDVVTKKSSSEKSQAMASETLPNPEEKSGTGRESGSNAALANGKLPDDIPPAQNDDALAAQIRYAAEIEKDPVKSAQLWNEYRKYKGLPQKK